ncbi:MAG TPA: glycosyltransferase family 4 protein [Candidatus Obscuribacterales bacterium]
MKILTITNCPLDPTLGSGKTVLRYSLGLRERGHTVDVFEPKDYEFLPAARRARQLRQALGSWLELPGKVKTSAYDLIEFYGSEFGLALRGGLRRRGGPLLVAHTNGLELLHRQRERAYLRHDASPLPRLKSAVAGSIVDWVSESTFQLTHAFVSLCEADRRFVLERKLYAPEMTAVVGPGLDSDFLSLGEPGGNPRDNRVAFTGSWTPRKGIDHLVGAMSRLLAERPELVLDIYGAHVPEGVILESFPPELRRQVAVHPPVTNKELVSGLTRARVFFFPSQYEGYGMAVTEAIRCGCAVVATPTGFAAELENGREAILCGFDDVDAMVSAIARLLDDEDLRRRIASQAWIRTQGMTWEAAVVKLESTYAQWVDEHRRKQPPSGQTLA